MHSKKKVTLSAPAVFYLLVTILIIVKVQIAQNKHILYFVPELDLYVRLSPDWYSPEGGEVLAFSREQKDLKIKNSKVLASGQDNLRFPGRLLSGRTIIPAVFVKTDSSITFYSTGIPHSVSIRMEELFDDHIHHQSPETQQLLSELPSFGIFSNGVRRHKVFSNDDRLTFIELEHFLY